VLEKRGFGSRLIGWIKKILTRGSIGITINNAEGKLFQTTKRLR
jgi:hypothetical protein